MNLRFRLPCQSGILCVRVFCVLLCCVWCGAVFVVCIYFKRYTKLYVRLFTHVLHYISVVAVLFFQVLCRFGAGVHTT